MATAFIASRFNFILLKCILNIINFTGIKSHHNNGKEDRKWRVRCCSAKNHHNENCAMSELINMLHGDIDYTVNIINFAMKCIHLLNSFR